MFFFKITRDLHGQGGGLAHLLLTRDIARQKLLLRKIQLNLGSILTKTFQKFMVPLDIPEQEKFVL